MSHWLTQAPDWADPCAEWEEHKPVQKRNPYNNQPCDNPEHVENTFTFTYNKR